MQVVHATFAAGEGKEAVTLLDDLGVEIEDYKLIESATGDLLILSLMHANVDAVIDSLRERFDFSNNVNRSMMIYTPDTIIPSSEEKIRQDEIRSSRLTIITYAKDNCAINGQLIFLAITAALIATLGLILDNTPVIVGAMIIAPVFGPIAAMAIGIVLGDLKLLARGALAEATVMAIAVSIGWVFGVLVPNVTVTHALQVRMLPTIADLLVALAAGGAGAYAMITNVKSQQLVGVVVAAALIPVMATIGIGLSLGNINMILGAGLLLLGNFFSLLLAIILVFYLKGLQPQWWYASTASKLVRRSLVILGVSGVLLTVPLSVLTYRQLIQQQPEDVLAQICHEHFSDDHDVRLLSSSIDGNKITLVVYTSKATNKWSLETITTTIRERLGNEYQIIYDVIPLQRIYTEK